MTLNSHKPRSAHWRSLGCLIAFAATGCGQTDVETVGRAESNAPAPAVAETGIQTVGFISSDAFDCESEQSAVWHFVDDTCADDSARPRLQPLPPVDDYDDNAHAANDQQTNAQQPDNLYSTPVVSLLPPQPFDGKDVDADLEVVLMPPAPATMPAPSIPVPVARASTEIVVQPTIPEPAASSTPEELQEDVATREESVPSETNVESEPLFAFDEFDPPSPRELAEEKPESDDAGATYEYVVTAPLDAPIDADPSAIKARPRSTNAPQSSREKQRSDRGADYDAKLHPVATGVPTGAKINEQATAKIRRGYALAQRGAYYSARAEFIDVLRMLAQGKDNLSGKPRRSTALSAGLRALDEAEDFAPRGTTLDADVDVAVIASSHRTPIADEAKQRLPQQRMDRYFRYAQMQLGAAVAGEPAGSMALHALGKLHSQLGRVEPEQNPLAERFAYAFQQAALFAHDGNHLAAHELGVLMAESGHYAEAEDLLTQVAAREPHPQVLKNLAKVHTQLGQFELAAAIRAQATAMQSQYASAGNVQWVAPNAFAQAGQSQMHRQWSTAPTRLARRPQ